MMMRTMIALGLLLTLADCDEVTRRTVYRATSADGGRLTQAAEQALPADCAPACKPPKYCDRTLRPPKCVVAVDGPGLPPESFHINYIERSPTLTPGEAPSDDEDPASLAN